MLRSSAQQTQEDFCLVNRPLGDVEKGCQAEVLAHYPLSRSFPAAYIDGLPWGAAKAAAEIKPIEPESG
jgi:hypothetical protein